MEGKKLKKVVLTVLKVFGVLFAAMAGVTALLMRRGTKFIKKHGSNMNTMVCATGSGNSSEIAKDIEVGFFSCLFGCHNIFWAEAPTKQFDLDVCSILSVMSITVPANMRVVCDIKAVGGMVTNRALDPEDENAPVLNITGKAICGMITIRSEEA